MTPLQQTALDFCRECLGWTDAETAPDWLSPNGISESVVISAAREESFRSDDLNAIMEAVAKWSRAAGKPIVCGLDEDGFWAASVGDISQTRHDSKDMCHALLAACLAAQRKLKGISHD